MEHSDPKEAIIRENHGKPLVSFNASNFELYYRLPREEVSTDEEWLKSFKILPREILNKWWASKGAVRRWANKEYLINMLKI